MTVKKVNGFINKKDLHGNLKFMVRVHFNFQRDLIKLFYT